MTHDEIAKKFIDSKAFNFDAMGKLISELGPTLAVQDDGWHGVVIGRFNTLACMLRADDVVRAVGDLREAGLAAEVIGRMGKAAISR